MEAESNKANLDIHIVLLFFDYSKLKHSLLFLPSASRIWVNATSLCAKIFVLFLDHDKTNVNETISDKPTNPSPPPSQKNFEMRKGFSEISLVFYFSVFKKNVSIGYFQLRVKSCEPFFHISLPITSYPKFHCLQIS